MSAIKTILMSLYPMPYHEIGSWSNMYNYYLTQKDHQIDYIICQESKTPVDSVVYKNLRNITILDKLKNKIKEGSRFSNYFEALQKIVKPNQKYILQIVDNSGLIVPLHHFIKEHFNRQHFYIQYFYHGFAPLIPHKLISQYAQAINEMVFLTHLSYEEHLKKYEEFTIKSTILHNGVDHNLFFKIDDVKKQQLKIAYQLNNKLVFIWCGHNGAKKGLGLILNVWKHLYEKHINEIELLIVGVHEKIDQKGVTNIGRIPNNELPKYYQMSDVYLFPSLWKEGFGLVLAEALRCGCYCIASNQGGIPEVLEHGKLGKLIKSPNIIDSWIKAIDNLLKHQDLYTSPSFEKDKYTLKKWSKQMNIIINDAKFVMQ